MPRSDMRSRSITYSAVTVMLIPLLITVGLGGFYVGRRIEHNLVGTAPATLSNTSSQKTDFGLFWQAWNIIDNKFYGTAKNDKRVGGAISGMVASLDDPYTTYFEPSTNKLFRSDLEGNFGGIGAELTIKNSQLTIVSALEGTPSEKAGLKPDDVITKIGDSKAAELHFNDAVDKIRGEKGTQVVLTISRSGVDVPFEVPLIRDTITVKSVKTTTIGPNNSVAYIKLNQFGDDTLDGLKAGLQEAKDSGKKGVVIDLRNNPGGFLQTAVQGIGLVIPSSITSDKAALRKRTAVLERSKDGTETAHATKDEPIWDTGSLVILVNGGSASASEIFAGAVKDYGRAKIVGTKTFGKGSVQELQDLTNGGSIKVTVAKWFTPLGIGIDGTGIEPDVKVELGEKETMSPTDSQVAKALSLIN